MFRTAYGRDHAARTPCTRTRPASPPVRAGAGPHRAGSVPAAGPGPEAPARPSPGGGLFAPRGLMRRRRPGAAPGDAYAHRPAPPAPAPSAARPALRALPPGLLPLPPGFTLRAPLS